MHTAPIDLIPKPSPRLTKPIPSDASATNDELITYSRQITENVADATVEQLPESDKPTDYSDTKMFWQSLDSNKPIDETAQSGMVPVPKPRSQMTTNIVKNEESFESNSVKELSQSSSKISSEQQVEYSESSSVQSDGKHELRDDDSMAVEERLEDESYPISDRVDSEFYDMKNRENSSFQCSKDDSFEIDLVKDKDVIVDLSATKKDDFSIYRTKEREDILDLDDLDVPIKRDLYKIDDFAEEPDPAEEKKTSFYIGESSGDIIKKSSDQRNDYEKEEFEFDDDVQKKIRTSAKEIELKKDECETTIDTVRSVKEKDHQSEVEQEIFEFGSDYEKKSSAIDRATELDKEEIIKCAEFTKASRATEMTSELANEEIEFGENYEKSLKEKDFKSSVNTEEVTIGTDSKSKVIEKTSHEVSSKTLQSEEKFIVEGKTDFPLNFDATKEEILDFQKHSTSQAVTQSSVIKKEEILGCKKEFSDNRETLPESKEQTFESEEKRLESEKAILENKIETLKSKADLLESKKETAEIKKETMESKKESLESKKESWESTKHTLESKDQSVESKKEILESKVEKPGFEIDFGDIANPLQTKSLILHSPLSNDPAESTKTKHDLTLRLMKNETEEYTKTLSDFETAEYTTESLPITEQATIVHSPVKTLKTSYEFSKPVLQESTKVSSTEVHSSIQSELNKINESFGDVRKIHFDKDEIEKSIVEQTFAEVQESLEAVQEDLIEVVKGGRLIKESPSEFEVKILPNIKYPQLEAHEEEMHSSPERSAVKVETETTRSDVSDTNVSQKAETDVSSAEDSTNKLDVVHRAPKPKQTTNRWSVSDPDNYSSSGSHYESFEKTDSRPCSSDVENLLTYGNSSEYQTALDASLLPGSTEYQSAASWLDNSGKTISSRESMKSFDSESSGHLGSVENSENSETLVPSTMDIDLPSDSNYEMDMDESEIKFASLEACSGVLLEEYNEEPDHVISPSMKRSQEMTFQPYQTDEDQVDKTSTLEKKSSLEGDDFKLGSMTSLDDSKFATSLEDGSVLSMSLSSASNVETIVENVRDEMASSFGSSLIGSYEVQSLIRDDATVIPFEDSHSIGQIDNNIMTTSIVKEDDTISSQITNTAVPQTEFAELVEQPMKRTKGHKRTDSTSFLKGLETSRSPPDTSLDDEMIIHDDIADKIHFDDDDKKGSGSDSDYDPYQSEYARSFKQPEKQGKKKSIIEKKIDKVEVEKMERKISIPSIETIVEDVIAEVECEAKMERAVSQNMLDYSNIPDITVTDDPARDSVEEDDDVNGTVTTEPTELQKSKPEESPASSPIHYARESEIKITEEEYQELIDKQYKAKFADVTTRFDYDEDKADSPTSDSFEMLEQPDITDEFVIIEEVAKEAGEFDMEGKGVSIKPMKYVKKHDEEVETILVKSAPAATNEGSVLYQHQGHHEMGFDFEDSPPTGVDASGSAYDANEMTSSRKWVEMQLAEQAQNLRYPYEMERGVLEDIKEEDTDLEVGSSRISSFKDSYSSSTPEYDIMAGRKYFAKGEHDDMSVNSLQEFESLEQAISLENRKFHQGSSDSLSNGSFPKRYTSKGGAHGDDVSMASLKEFEGLENACLEAHLIEIKAKEEAALLLSRSDESNKSDKSKGSPKLTTITTKTTVVTQSQSQSIPSRVVEERVTTTTSGFPMNQKSLESFLRSKFEDKDDDSSSNLMEVSSDSLDTGSRVKLGQSKDSTHYGSSDSLEQNKSGTDIMTSSLDSIEVSKEAGATAKSSRSDVDSIDQYLLSGKNEASRRDSIDSIEMQLALMAQAGNYERDSIDGNTRIDVETTVSTSGNQTVQTRTITTTTMSSSTYDPGMSKDISSDSLNVNQSEPELLLTSTESLDQTSSVATNATYTNEMNSQMSGSITSCGSTTLIDSLDGPFEFQSGIMAPSSSQFGFDDRQLMGGTPSSSTTTTTTTVVHLTQTKDGEKTYEYFEVKDDKGNARKGRVYCNAFPPLHTLQLYH